MKNTMTFFTSFPTSPSRQRASKCVLLLIAHHFHAVQASSSTSPADDAYQGAMAELR